jgi:hypothetical protein
MTKSQRDALNETLNFLKAESGKSHQGYFGPGGWAYEELLTLLEIPEKPPSEVFSPKNAEKRINDTRYFSLEKRMLDLEHEVRAGGAKCQNTSGEISYDSQIMFFNAQLTELRKTVAELSERALVMERELRAARYPLPAEWRGKRSLKELADSIKEQRDTNAAIEGQE